MEPFQINHSVHQELIQLLSNRVSQSQDLYQNLRDLKLPPINFKKPEQTIQTLIREWKHMKKLLDLVNTDRIVKSTQKILQQNLAILQKISNLYVADPITARVSLQNFQEDTQNEFSPLHSRSSSIFNLDFQLQVQDCPTRVTSPVVKALDIEKLQNGSQTSTPTTVSCRGFPERIREIIYGSSPSHRVRKSSFRDSIFEELVTPLMKVPAFVPKGFNRFS